MPPGIHSIGEVRRELAWFSPREQIEVALDQHLTDLGDGRFVSDVHETYRSEQTGELAFSSPSARGLLAGVWSCAYSPRCGGELLALEARPARVQFIPMGGKKWRAS